MPASTARGCSKTERIRARIREIQSGLAADHGRDMDVLLGKLEIVYRRAIEDHHFYAAARAVELQAKLGRMAKLPPLINAKAGPRGGDGDKSLHKPTKAYNSMGIFHNTGPALPGKNRRPEGTFCGIVPKIAGYAPPDKP